MNMMNKMMVDGVGISHAGITRCTKCAMVLMLAAHAFIGCSSKDIDTGIYDNQPLDEKNLYIEIVNMTEYDVMDIKGADIGYKSRPIIKSGEAKWIRIMNSKGVGALYHSRQQCLVGGHWSEMRLYSESEGRVYGAWRWKWNRDDDPHSFELLSPFKRYMSLYLIREGRQFYLTNVEP